MSIFKGLVTVLTVLVGLIAPVASVANDNPKPDEIVAVLTEEVLVAIEVAKPTFASDPEPFYQALDTIIMPRMDVRNFARGVMGRYGSTSYYRSLKTNEERTLFKQRINTFANVFKESVVRTYGKGLMTFSGQKINLVPLDDEQKQKIANGKTVEILQTIEASDGAPHELRYSFGRNKRGIWLVRNLLVDGINLGKVYQSQFAQAVKDKDGDIDAAIQNWVVSDEEIDIKAN